MTNENTFQYTYSAPQNQEVLRIREKYLPKEETKLDELRRLDAAVHNAGTAKALAIGVCNALMFGLGMSLALQVIGNSTGVGILLGILGVFGMGFAYPVYKKEFGKAKEEYKPRILEITAELTGEI